MNLGTRFDLYVNTQNNRRLLGLDDIPEYVFGDSSHPYIMHDTKRGEYTYVPESFFDGIPAPSVWLAHTKNQFQTWGSVGDLFDWER